MDNAYFTVEENLKNDLNEIKAVFNTNSLLEQNFNNFDIQKYYKYSGLAYDLLHSKEGSIHMALNYDGVYNIDGYSKQALEINDLISKNSKVLELGCGKGYNLAILAEKDKTSDFFGIDISNSNLNYAKKKAEEVSNLTFKFGSFQEIPFEDNSFDLVYGIETICYSENIEVLLKEVKRILKKNGKFVIYDAFIVADLTKREEIIRETASLCVKAMAVNKFHMMTDWIRISQSNGFVINTNDDISLAVMPNLKRLYRGSKKYLKNKFLAKLILLLLPSYLVKNSIAGILMPYSIMMKDVYKYNKIIMTQTGSDK